ncbi:hypothetical protein K7432_007979 [Basidiobolus ranarum]|uniref:Uncharacterized protein n=1 Tax=Basidiobolus ranarum TaxID=34480 RepID=A0ABR2VZ99_9FUNG
MYSITWYYGIWQGKVDIEAMYLSTLGNDSCEYPTVQVLSSIINRGLGSQGLPKEVNNINWLLYFQTTMYVPLDSPLLNDMREKYIIMIQVKRYKDSMCRMEHS